MVNFFIFPDQVLRKKQQPHIPPPLAIWELSKASFIEEQKTDMTFTPTKIGIDPLWTPAGFIGSPLFSSVWTKTDPNPSSIILDYKNPTPSWQGITIMFWLRVDEADKKMNIMVIFLIIYIFVSTPKISKRCIYPNQTLMF